jgi:murein DD-endopeptidase MepM/ murein hydrolase activator NlpD
MALALLAGTLVSSPAGFATEADTKPQRPSPEEETRYHMVEPGETLTVIAKKYGVSIESLVRANEIADPQAIRAGARLRIPTSPQPDATRAVDAAAVKAGGDVNAVKSDQVDALLERCEAELRAAHFEEALASAAEVRAKLDARSDATGNADAARRVRLEIATATADVALEHRDAALEALERALAADPGLELDPALTSPKVLAVFRAARSRTAPSP